MTIPTDDMIAAGVAPAVVAAFTAVNTAFASMRDTLRPATMDDLARVTAEVHRLRQAVADAANDAGIASEARALAQGTRDMVSAISVTVAFADDDVGGNFDPETSTIQIRLPAIGSDINLHSQQW